VATPQSAVLYGQTGNLFLDSLSPESAAQLLPKLEKVAGAVGLSIGRGGVPLEHVVFPVGSVVSAVTRMNDGTDIEVTLIGRDGYYGVHLALGSDTSSNDAMVQIPDTFLRMRSADFVEALRADAPLKERALAYALAMLESLGQFSACNRLHPVNERCARWLLMAHDRVATDEIFLTHEYLAVMLGVRRPSVSLAAAALDQAGVIEYRRGRIRVTNRAGLEAVSCECYAVANDSMERLLGYSARKRSSPTVAK
jgi:CRP-like cAMP-binding protein